MKVTLLVALFFAPALLAAEPTTAPPAPAPVNRTGDIFETLDNQYREETEKGRVAVARRSRMEAERDSGGPPEPTAFPTLVRIYGFVGSETCVFEQGAAKYEARPGDPVTPEWTLDAVRPAGVLVRNAKNGEKRLLMLGTRSLAPRGIGLNTPEIARAAPASAAGFIPSPTPPQNAAPNAAPTNPSAPPRNPQ